MIRLLIKKCDQWAIYSAWHNQHPLIGVRPQLWNYRPAFRLWQILVAIDESVTTRRPLVLSTIFPILFHASGETLLTVPFCWIKSKFVHLNSAIQYFVDDKLLRYFCSRFSLDDQVSFEKTIFRTNFGRLDWRQNLCVFECTSHYLLTKTKLSLY